MKKAGKILAFTLLSCAMSFTFFNSKEAKAGDHVGYKKIFLRAHCKADPNYVCRLSDPPQPIIKL